ncbi:MAG TPA: hypothetical protein VF627_08370 [Abditibacterium sp.]|jgi:hypothetical protein
MTLETLIHQFHARTLPREAWNHRAHLGVALWTLRRFPIEAALQELRVGIVVYNASGGVESGPFSGYHATITQFFALAVADFLLHDSNCDDEDELWAQLNEKWGDKSLIFSFYSRRALFSPASRAAFAPPDLAPLPFPKMPRS